VTVTDDRRIAELEAEVARLRAELAQERATVVAYLNATSLRLEENDDPEWGIIADLALHIQAGFHIERGDHRREEEK
jgi:hypothetical protein